MKKGIVLSACLFLICFFLLGINTELFAQPAKTYFDAEWQPVKTASKATYYRTVRDSGKLSYIEDFYANGKPYRHGLAAALDPIVWEGEVVTYRPTRKRKQFVAHYKNGVLHGTSTEFYAREQKHIVREYEEGKEVSTTWFFHTGQKMLEIDGKRLDKWAENGKKIESFDPETGIHSYWHPSGQMTAQGGATDYLHRHGAWEFFHLSGNPAAKGSYENDEKTGSWSYFDGAGALTSTFDNLNGCVQNQAVLEEFLTLDSTMARTKPWLGESVAGAPQMAILFKSTAHAQNGKKAWQNQVDRFRHCQHYWDYWTEEKMDTSFEGLTSGIIFSSRLFGNVEETGGLIAVKIYLLDFADSNEQFLIVEFAKG